MEQQTNVLHEFHEPAYEFASTGQRFLNYLIDVIVFYILMLIVGFIVGAAFASSISDGEVEGAIGFAVLTYLFVFVIFFAYYTFLEGSKGKTLGKMITKTKVIREDGQPMTYGKALLRTLCRLVPFEFISAFLGQKMWHDQWTGTITVKDN
jgi:uncharacterized RDD family membrane protein YckC